MEFLPNPAIHRANGAAHFDQDAVLGSSAYHHVLGGSDIQGPDEAVLQNLRSEPLHPTSTRLCAWASNIISFVDSERLYSVQQGPLYGFQPLA